MREKIESFKNKVLKDKRYYIALIAISFIAYGFSIFNRTVSIDDLSYSMFAGDNHMAIAGYRWGIYVLNLFLYTEEYTPFIGRIFAYIFLLIDAVLLSFLFYLFDNKQTNVWEYTILACIFCTYPLINELWYCTCLSVPIQYNGVSYYFLLTFLSLIYQCLNDDFSIKKVLISGALMAPVMSGYESVAFAYVSIVFIILFFKNRNIDNKYNWLLDGLKFAVPLIVALVLRYSIGYILILLLKPTSVGAGNATIKWFSDGISECLKNILYNGWYYVVRALSYFPITEFLVSLIVFMIVVIKDATKHMKNSIVIGMLLVISLFFLSLLQGEYLHYRTAQTVQIFVSFVCYLVVSELEDVKILKISLKPLVITLMIILSIRQSVYLHELLALNNQRSDNEAYIAQTIGYELYSEYDVTKTVIFCGEYQLGSFIEDQITVKEGGIADKVETYIRELTGHDEGRLYQEYVCTNINSFFNTQMDAFNGQVMIQKYLSYYGFDIKVLENLTDEEEDKLKGYYELIAKENNMKPYEIKDMGDYILVYLGPTIDGTSKLKYK